MAAPKSKAAGSARKPRKKEKKNITVGQAHIKSTFNNTIVSITDAPVLLSLGLHRVTLASRVPVSRPLTPLRWLPSQQLARLRSTA